MSKTPAELIQETVDREIKLIQDLLDSGWIAIERSGVIKWIDAKDLEPDDKIMLRNP